LALGILVATGCFAMMWHTPVQHKKAIMDAAACATKTYSDAGIPFWLDCGSLLGSFRDGKIIPWDSPVDVDMAIFQSDSGHARTSDIRDAMAACGVLLVHRDDLLNRFLNFVSLGWGHWSIKRPEYRAYAGTRFRCAYVDIQTLGHFDPGGVLGPGYVADNRQIRSSAGEIPFWHVNSILPLQRCKLEGLHFSCPRDTPNYLESAYGKDFEAPRRYRKTWDAAHAVVPNAKYHDSEPHSPYSKYY
jgi:hypothetical protein